MSLNAEELAAIREVQATQRANWERLEEFLEEIETAATELASGSGHFHLPGELLPFLMAHIAAELNMRQGLRMLGELGGLN